MDEAGRLVIRSSTQVPFLTQRALCEIFGLPPEQVRVLAERVGGGFGGKQEMLTEDVVAAAVLATGRPVKLEFTRDRAVLRHDHAPPHAFAGQGRRDRRDGTVDGAAA